MKYRKYNHTKDKEAVFRIWKEVGWIAEDRTKEKDKIREDFIKSSLAHVAEIRDNAECLVLAMPGTIRYLENELSFSAVTSVTTSSIARRKNIATELTAISLAKSVSNGICVAGLGIFDQGFYDKLGFGNGPYEHLITFDPSNLKLESNKRIPFRITLKDFEKIHNSRLSRIRGHGSVNIYPANYSKLELSGKKDFGLGFFDEETGELTHHFWISVKGEQGPYNVLWMCYQNYEQFIELLSVLKGLSDQVISVRMREPPGIQIQDFLKKPFRYREMTKNAKHENYMSSSSYQQLRILDLKTCVENTHLPLNGPRFNLELKDPIINYLSGTEWKGVGGDYIIKFGKNSEIIEGNKKGLPKMTASIGAFTRMWLGVRSATSLSVTDDLKAPKELLKKLDNILRLPTPKVDWDF